MQNVVFLFYCNNNVMINAAHTIEVLEEAVSVCKDTIRGLDFDSSDQVNEDDIQLYLKGAESKNE